MKKIEVLGLQTIPEIKEGDNLAEIIVNRAESEQLDIEEKDIIVLTSKIVSKAMGLTAKLADVKPAKRALKVSQKTGKDPKWLQMIWDLGQEIVAVIPLKGMIRDAIMHSSQNLGRSEKLCEHEQAICITLSKDGRLHTCDAGIDGSNHPAGIVSFLPPDPDEVAEAIREEIKTRTSKNVAVILADTEILPFGTVDLAVGSSGIEPRSKMFGDLDKFGKPKFGGIDLTAYELAAAAALLFGQTNAGIPAVIIRGYDFEINEVENISNTIIPNVSGADSRKVLKEIIRATACVRPFKQRLLLKIALWFV